MNKKIYLALIPVVTLCAIVIVYINNDTEEEGGHSVDITTTRTDISAGEGLTTTTKAIEGEKIIEKESSLVLAVSPDRCRGCGRCAMIDPEHFQLSGRKAVVISNENLDSAGLERAIESCPEEAITLTKI